MPDVLVASGLSRWFDTGSGRIHAVRDASLRVAEAEMVAVLGRSGAGTSALLSVCGGLEQPDQGTLFVAGRDVPAMNPAERVAFLERTLGWVPQRPSLLELLTLQENVAVALRIAGEAEAEAARAALVALEALGLGHLAARRGTDLSAAEQRLGALARALVKAPALLVADQPAAHLDVTATSEVMALLREAAASGTAVLYATHDEAAAAAADRVLRMEEGALTEA